MRMTGDWIKAPTFTARIYIGGDRAIAEQVCREYCTEVGLCVTVEPTEFGVVVGLLNYPRFPSEPNKLLQDAHCLALLLVERLCQRTALIVTPDETKWFKRTDIQV